MLNAVKSQWGVLVEVEFLLTKFEEVNMKTTNCAYLDIASSTLLNELRSLKEMEKISTLKIYILKMTYKNKCPENQLSNYPHQLNGITPLEYTVCNGSSN